MQVFQVRLLTIAALILFWTVPALAEDSVANQAPATSSADKSTTPPAKSKAPAASPDVDKAPAAQPSVPIPEVVKTTAPSKEQGEPSSDSSPKADPKASGAGTAKTKSSTSKSSTSKSSTSKSSTSKSSTSKRKKRARSRAKRKMVRIARSKRPDYHVVRRGDWLSKIAFRYSMGLKELKKLNGLKGDSIEIGHKLRLRATPLAEAAEAAEKLPETTSSSTVPQATHATEEVVMLPALPSLPEVAQQAVAASEAGEDALPDVQDAPAVSDATKTADVEIPTLALQGVKPLSRARIVLVCALLVLGLLALHPRTRQVLTNRLPAWMSRKGADDSSTYEIEIHSSRNVGSNQQILFFEVADTRLLVGISDGRMDLLHRWGDSHEAAAANHELQIQQAQGDDAPNARPGVARAALQFDGEGETDPELTPCAEQLLDTWRNTVAEQRSNRQFDLEGGSWWMEGATYAEKNRLSCDELVAATDGTLEAPVEIGAERQQVEESVLATLRTRRVESQTHAQTSTRGSQSRPRRSNNSSDGFPAAARLGRRPAAPAVTSEEPIEDRGPKLKGNRLNFQL